jgi:hypothetical protein
MGGSHNTATPLPGVTATSPAGVTTVDGREAGSNWAGHAVAYSTGLAPNHHIFAFDTTRDDVVVVVAEFPGLLIPEVTGAVITVR